MGKAIKAADGSDEGQIYPLVLYLSSARLWNENRTGRSIKFQEEQMLIKDALIRKEEIKHHLSISSY